MKNAAQEHLNGLGASEQEMVQTMLLMRVPQPGLKMKRNGRIDTNWGDRTPLGLLRTIRRILKEA